MKAPVPDDAVARVRAALGAPRAVVEQVDTYLAHPARDFATTDEALRLRRAGERVELTYKGPKIDATSKARREVTVAVHSYDEARALLDALGFRVVADVRKRRAVSDFGGLEASLDEVDGLGTFVELEAALEDGASFEVAREATREALAALGLDRTERRSYLELLLEKKR